MFKKKKNIVSTPEVEKNELNFETTEESLKSDSAIVIGEYKDNSYVATEAKLPNKIDIEARRKARIDAQYSKKKKAVVKDDDKETRIVQSITALVVLLLFGFVYGVYKYYKDYDIKHSFGTRQVHVEYGSPATLKIADYITKSNPDEKEYYLDLSELVPDEIGEYHYKISYKGMVKSDIIEVSDTTPPEVEVKVVNINPGETYTPEMFVNKCVDIKGCTVTFEDGTTIKTAEEKDAGEKAIYIIAKDECGNQVTKQSKLITKSTNIIYSCSKTEPYNYDLGYRNATSFKLTFDKDNNYIGAKKLSITEYVDNNDYLAFKKGHTSSVYEYDDSINKVTTYETYKDGFNNNTTYQTVITYLRNEGYTCVYDGD